MSKISCDYLATTLMSNPFHLRKLILDGNNLQESDVKHLIDLVESPFCILETLRSVDGWSVSMLLSNPNHSYYKSKNPVCLVNLLPSQCLLSSVKL